MSALPIILWLVFVQPNGETYTPQEQAYTVQQVTEAAAFWGYTVTELHTRKFEIAIDPYTNSLDAWGYVDRVWKPNQAITIYIVDNSISGNYFFNNSSSGYAHIADRWIVVRLNDSLAAVTAHELGHVLYGLPDWYTQAGKCTAIDIMCDANAAYSSGIKGCLTLAFIGHPCYTVSLPLVTITKGSQVDGNSYTTRTAGRYAVNAYDQSCQKQKRVKEGRRSKNGYLVQ
jgi:hypothetical protein